MFFIVFCLFSISGNADPVVVKTGDTMYSLSKKYNLTVAELAKKNNIIAPYSLRVGQMLYVESQNKTKTKTGSKTYKVVSGDTLFSIAKQNNISLSDLKKYNGLLSANLQLGQVLQLISPVAENVKIENKEPITTSILKSIANVFVEEKEVLFTSPLKGKVISAFGVKPSGLKNNGVNIEAKNGAEIVVAEDGIVVFVGNTINGFGNTIIVKHAQNYMTVYAHADEILVNLGEKIKKNSKIATVGKTGKVKSSQLHFEIVKNLRHKNPVKLINLNYSKSK
ncbi:MAG: LysM peptidoglycan-binding domain-containing protein [Alphaproteobacteria bacterium]